MITHSAAPSRRTLEARLHAWALPFLSSSTRIIPRVTAQLQPIDELPSAGLLITAIAGPLYSPDRRDLRAYLAVRADPGLAIIAAHLDRDGWPTITAFTLDPETGRVSEHAASFVCHEGYEVALTTDTGLNLRYGARGWSLTVPDACQCLQFNGWSKSVASWSMMTGTMLGGAVA